MMTIQIKEENFYKADRGSKHSVVSAILKHWVLCYQWFVCLFVLVLRIEASCHMHKCSTTELCTPPHPTPNTGCEYFLSLTLA